MLKFNSLNSAIFNANSAEFANEQDNERAKLVTCGRLLMMERNGRDVNALRTLQNVAAEYTPILSDAAGENSYAETNRNLQHKLMMYCAARACAVTGEKAPADYNEFMRQQRKFLSDEIFLRTLAGIVRDVVTPILPITMSNALSWMAETVSVPLGQTHEIDVASNDIFMFEDDSWGASRSKPSNYLYSYPITLNPTLRTAKTTIKWYQLVGNDADLGRWFNALSAGMYSKIVALYVKALTAGTNSTFFVPSNLTFTNTSANWVTAAARLAAVNGTGYRSIIAVGHPSALTKALPSGVVNASTVNLDAALATMLGAEWARYGYLGEYMGIRLMPLEDSIVPGTQNTTITSLIPNNKIWLMATNGYKPVYIGMEDGTPITVQLDPSETADMTIDIIVSMSIDAKPVFASKIAVINA